MGQDRGTGQGGGWVADGAGQGNRARRGMGGGSQSNSCHE